MAQVLPNITTASQRESRRLKAGQLLRTTSLSKAEIARRLGVTRSAVTQWAKQIKKRRRGLDSLRSRPHTGRPPMLTNSEWRHVLALLRRGAIAAGFKTDRWTLARIQQLVQCEYGVSYSKSYLSDKLYALGWISQQRMSKNKMRMNKHKYSKPDEYFPDRGWFWRSFWQGRNRSYY